MECTKEKNQQDCTCDNKDCERNGMYCQCVRHHLAKNQLPSCCFPKEHSGERAMEKFADLVKAGAFKM